MELPFYYSYEVFLENWENDYQKYLEFYPNCSMEVFLDEIHKGYSQYMEKYQYLVKWYTVNDTIPCEIEDEQGDFHRSSMPIEDFYYYLKIKVREEKKTQDEYSNYDVLDNLTFFDWSIDLKDGKTKVNASDYKMYKNFI